MSSIHSTDPGDLAIKPTLSCTRCAIHCVSSNKPSRTFQLTARQLEATETDRLSRLDMILFEDRLQNLLLAPRSSYHLEPEIQHGRLIKRSDEPASLWSSWFEELLGSPDANLTILRVNANLSSPRHFLSVHGLSHYTRYVFVISACHSPPHSATGLPLNMDPRHIYSSEIPSNLPWCSTGSAILQTTLPIPEKDAIDGNRTTLYNYQVDCDQLDPATLFHACSPFDLNGSVSNVIQVTEFRWFPPSNPNGFVLFYWVRYRLVKLYANNQAPSWTVVCIPTQQAGSTSSIRLRLYNLLPGLYEYQLMSVTLAGNSSWTTVRQFDLWPKWETFVLRFLRVHRYAVVLFFVLLVVLCAVLAWFTVRRSCRAARISYRIPQSQHETLLDELCNDHWELDWTDVQWDRRCLIGQGSFGQVYSGVLTRLTTPAAVDLVRGASDPSRLAVAIKTLPPDATDDDVREFVGEAAFMRNFACPHIVRLVGVLSPHRIHLRFPALVLELMNLGDLATYLRWVVGSDPEVYRCGAVQSRLALDWAVQIASGMAFLQLHNLVHRDLAARNCLVNEHLAVKIADFGMARTLNDAYYYRKHGRCRIPVRWMSPEALSHAYFTVKSDIWAFGIVLWEIATFATVPYAGLSHEEVIAYVTQRGLMDLRDWPSQLPSVLLELVIQCWSFAPNDRPDFVDILDRLSTVMDDNCDPAP